MNLWDAHHIKEAAVGVLGLISLATTAITGVLAAVDPLEADKWPLYGVLISAIIALATCVAVMARAWVKREEKWREEDARKNEKLLEAYGKNAAIIERHAEQLERVNAFWDGAALPALRDRLHAPAPASVILSHEYARAHPSPANPSA